MRYMEWAGLDTVSTTYAPILVDDYYFTVMRYCPGGAYFFTTCFGTVHAGMSPE
jgi:hypothetical protein